MKRLILSVCAVSALVMSSFGQGYSEETLNAVMDSIETNPEYVYNWIDAALQKDKKCSDALVIKSMVYLMDENYQFGINQLNAAMKMVGKKSVYSKAKIVALRGHVYRMIGEEFLAMDDLNAAVKMDPKDIEVLEERADYLMEARDYEKAEADYRKLIKLGGSLDHKLNLAKCLVDQDKLDEALGVLNKAIQYQPKEPEPYGQRALLFLNLDRIQWAIDDYITYVALEGDYEFSGLVFFGLMDSDYMLSKLSQMITIDPENSTWLAARLRLQMALGHYDLALQDLDVLENTDGVSLFSTYQRSQCYSELYEFDKQLKCLNDLVEQMADEPSAQVYSTRGVANRNLGNLDAAISDLTTAIQLNPTDVSVYLERGLTYEMQQQFTEAMVDYNSALTYDEEDLFGLLQRGKLYLMNGDNAKAKSDFEQVLLLDSAYMAQAYALVLLGRVEEGIAYVKDYYKDTNDPISANYNTACVYALGNRKAEAIEALQKAVDAGYKNYFHMKYDSDLESLHNEPGYLKILESIQPKK